MTKKITGFLIILVFLYSCKDVKKEYYSNGELMVEVQFEDDLMNGYYKEYYPDGSIKVESNYKDGKLDGNKILYYNNGQIEWEATYDLDIVNGIFKKYLSNGTLIGESYFKNGKQDGIIKSYHKNSNLESESEFKSGLLNGYFKSYFEDGSLSMDAISRNDTTIYYREYDKDGILIDEYRSLLINSETDTINVNDTYLTELELEGPIPSDTAFFSISVFHYDNNFGSKETILSGSVVKTTNNKATYSYKPKEEGIYSINVLVFIGRDGQEAYKNKQVFYAERYFYAK